MSVAILGGHGKIALLAAELLAKNGYKVTSYIRDTSQTKDIEKTGARAEVLDIENSSVSDLSSAFKKSDIVIWSAGAGGNGGSDRTYAVDRDAVIRAINAAEQSGVKHYLTVSFLGSGTDLKGELFEEGGALYHYAKAKAAADEHLRKSKLNWTVLGPGSLSDDAPSGKIKLNPPADSIAKTVSRGNVALLTLWAVQHPKETAHKTIDFLDGETEISNLKL